MRYAKLETEAGRGYVELGLRAGELWAERAMAGPEEDPLPPLARFAPVRLAACNLLAPVRPTKIVCVGRNYRDHAAELGNDAPAEPLLFLKPPSAVLAPGGVIVMPPVSRRVDYEGELGVVIGKRCSRLGAGEEVRPYLRGYVLVNDVTARDLQKSDSQWTRGKGFDTFCPVGPLVSDELDPLTGSVTVTTHRNGVLVQTGQTRDFLFGIAELVRYISAVMTLEPGDLIPTGTPAGVGPMQPGDTVTVAIEGLGTLSNTTAAG